MELAVVEADLQACVFFLCFFCQRKQQRGRGKETVRTVISTIFIGLVRSVSLALIRGEECWQNTGDKSGIMQYLHRQGTCFFLQWKCFHVASCGTVCNGKKRSSTMETKQSVRNSGTEKNISGKTRKIQNINFLFNTRGEERVRSGAGAGCSVI